MDRTETIAKKEVTVKPHFSAKLNFG